MRKKATTTDLLPCALTDDELLERSERLSRLFKAAKDMEARHKAKKAEMKSEADELSAQVNEVMHQVREKAEDRPVTIDVILDDHAKTVYYVRTDTGEVIRSRKMTEAEAQMDLTDEEAKVTYAEAIEKFQERGIDPEPAPGD